MLELYRALLALRAVTPALSDGSLDLVDAPDGVLAYRRTADRGGDVTVLVSMVDDATDIVGLSGTILVDSLGASPPGSRFGGNEAGTLASRQALVIRT